MSITQTESGSWKVDIEPVHDKRYRRTFKTKAEAMRFEALVRQRHTEKRDWNPAPKERRKLKELIKAWYELHGHTLKDGERRARKLEQAADRLGNPKVLNLTPEDYNKERSKRQREGITRKTLNNELGYLKSVFNELKALKVLTIDNPLEEVKPLKLDEQELSYLTKEEIRELLQALDKCDNPHTKLIATVCLATGARWSEAEELTPKRVKNQKVTFAETKSGKTRSIPISEALETQLKEHWKTYGPFTGAITSFRRALARTKIELPRGQATHALRHSFASHFVMNGGNILTLQKILGHSSLIMTMRYAHLSPDHLQEAVTLGPLSGISFGDDSAKCEKGKK